MTKSKNEWEKNTEAPGPADGGGRDWLWRKGPFNHQKGIWKCKQLTFNICQNAKTMPKAWLFLQQYQNHVCVKYNCIIAHYSLCLNTKENENNNKEEKNGAEWKEFLP